MPDLTLRLDDTDLTVTVLTALPLAAGASSGASGRVGPAGVDIARYAFDPGGAPSEGPKPFLHPVRALDGAPLTAYRPWDHRWHKGLQMTWTHVSGENFWGGNTYRPGTGDYALLDNVGRMRHDGFTEMTDAGAEVSFTEQLTWITQGGEEWVAEARTHRFHGVDAERGLWLLDFSTTLRNIAGRDLEFGSPTTQGRPNAGYTGFVIRMPRAWTGGRVLADGLPDDAGADAVMGLDASWVALSGEHDESDGGGTVLAFAGSSSGCPAIRWFVRSEPFPILAPSPSFDEHIVLAPGAELSLAHRHVFGDRIWTPDETRALAAELAP
ncbi:PmoA family protein [Microbacterium sp. QXD-8]|uniref:PmoA family protein n=1 Tax=Microbacterium psychrotolerans TaxID=3068321 RepID=A0ABU0Z3C8_9MICO|nr:PmoA family protein [Microbacterium sp. QXD-8]MDQ7879085.1 PmoA family protein [Microbacterium sp. QXD-8]